MPIFEYVCRRCDSRFEALISAPDQTRCPECESADLEQQYSSFAVGTAKGKGQFAKSSPSAGRGCGACGDPRGPGSCSTN